MTTAGSARHAYVYRLVNMRESSSYYGACEVCKMPASEVFLMVEMLASAGLKNPRIEGYTFHGCTAGLFGHRECLMGRQRVGMAIESKASSR